MLEIRYSLNEDIGISGSPEEIEELRRKVLGFLKTNLEKIQVETDFAINPQAWDSVAEGPAMIQTGDTVKVSVSDERVVKIEGSRENLERFAAFLKFAENAQSGRHSHYEHYVGDKCIAADSIPLTIGIK